MKNVQDGSSIKGMLVIGTGGIKWAFDLSNFKLDKNTPYESTVQTTGVGTSTSEYVSSVGSAITLQTKTTGFFFSTEGKKDTDKQATFTITVNLSNSGYMLDDTVSYVSTDGFKLVLKLGNNETWEK